MRRLGMEAWIIAIIAFALLIYLFYALLWAERF
jgi:K+-transporting ATPase KdpF subunit